MKKILLATLCIFTALVSTAQSSDIYVLTPVAPNTGTRYTIPDGSGTYTVLKGNTVYSIAKLHGMSVAQLKDQNGLSSNEIIPGSQLTVNTTTTIGRGLSIRNDNASSNTGDYSYNNQVETTYENTAVSTPSVSSNSTFLNHTSTNSAVMMRSKILIKEGKNIDELKGSHVDRGDSIWWYVAKDEDTYHTIATKYDMNFENLKIINGMNDYLLAPGMVLIVQPGELYGMIEKPENMPAPTSEDSTINREDIEGSIENTMKKELTTTGTAIVDQEIKSSSLQNNVTETIDSTQKTSEVKETVLEKTDTDESLIEETESDIEKAKETTTEAADSIKEATEQEVEDKIEDVKESVEIDW